MNNVANKQQSFILPPSIVTKADLSHIVLELEQLDDMLTQAAARGKVGVQSEALPTLSQQLNDFLLANNIRISTSAPRTEIINWLRRLKNSAPVVHVVFAKPIEREMTQQIVQWFRASAHPFTVLTIGLQSSLVGGAYIRTPNHVYDFSLKSLLQQNRSVLERQLEALSGAI